MRKEHLYGAEKLKIKYENEIEKEYDTDIIKNVVTNITDRDIILKIIVSVKEYPETKPEPNNLIVKNNFTFKNAQYSDRNCVIQLYEYTNDKLEATFIPNLR